MLKVAATGLAILLPFPLLACGSITMVLADYDNPENTTARKAEILTSDTVVRIEFLRPSR
jgi:hypothetical protein